MFEVPTYEFARSEVDDIACAENRLVVSGSVRIKSAQQRDEFRSDVGEVDECVNVELWLCLVW